MNALLVWIDLALVVAPSAYAMRYYSNGEVGIDPTIQSCWDADRLDLGRVSIKPAPAFLSSEGAVRIDFAYRWSKRRNHRKAHSLSH